MCGNITCAQSIPSTPATIAYRKFILPVNTDGTPFRYIGLVFVVIIIPFIHIYSCVLFWVKRCLVSG